MCLETQEATNRVKEEAAYTLCDRAADLERKVGSCSFHEAFKLTSSLGRICFQLRNLNVSRGPKTP